MDIPPTNSMRKTMDALQERILTAQTVMEVDKEREEKIRLLKIRQRLANSLGRRYFPDMVTPLENFRVYHANQDKVLLRLKAIGDMLPERISRGDGVIFYGTVGTGKDHLLAWLLYQAAHHGFESMWLNGQEFFGTLRDRMEAGLGEGQYLGDLAKPTVLGISDPVPAVGKPTPWNILQLYRLLDRRYRAMKPTWISMNAINLEDADSKLSTPVFDRLRDSAELIPCFWPSYREKRK